MSNILSYLERLGLEQYHDVFLQEGFDTWETLLDIQEPDLEQLGVKLGHRRKLQRAIAESRGITRERPLVTLVPEGRAADSPKADDTTTQSGPSKDTTTTTGAEQKRKYRRHPKPDEHAPEKPPSAYVLFSNRVREEIKQDNLSFTEIARLVGDRWQKLDPKQKEPFETQAAHLKDAYSMQLANYKKTDQYREYAAYLVDFRAKHGTSENKRPKLDQTESNASQKGSNEQVPQLSQHTRGGSIGSMSIGSHNDVLHVSMAPSTSISGHTQSSADTVTAGQLSPTHPSRSQSRPHFGIFSASSSISEDLSARTDFDPIPRAATLSLTNPPATISPLPVMSLPATARPDYLTGIDPLWYARTNMSSALHTPSSVITSASGPRLSHTPFIGSNTFDTTRQTSSLHPISSAPMSASLPISRLLGPDMQSESGSPSTAVPRVLPPPRVLPLNDNAGRGRGTPLTFNNVRQHNLLGDRSEVVPSSQTIGDQRQTLPTTTIDPSEAEAAVLLARLASRQESRSSQGQSRPSRPWE